MLRNVVERIFRVLKCCFQIYLHASDFPFLNKVKLVYSATALHNFISLSGYDFPNGELGPREDVSTDASLLPTCTGDREFSTTSAFCDRMAHEMWYEYLRHCA